MEDSIMKKLLSFIIFVLCISLSTTAYAGGWGRGGYHGNRGYYGGHGGGYYCGHGWHDGYNGWEVAAAVLGTFIVVDAINRLCYAPAPVAVRAGHWETQQIWVPGTSQRYWVNQYYDSIRNVWVLGHWEERPGTPGYWTQRQVWVVP
jgi:hypothetical protein